MSVKKIFYNTLLQSAGKMISLIIAFVNVLLLTRYLQESGYGEYTTVISFMGFFGILADLGLYLVTTQLISREGADERGILSTVFSLRLVSVIAMLLVGAIVALFLPYSATVKQAMFIGIINFIFVSGTQVLVGVFQKYLIFYKLVASEIVGRAVGLVTTYTFIWWHFGLLSFIVSMTLASTVHFFISLVIARKIIPFGLKFDLSAWKTILAASWPLAFSVVLNLIYFKADTLILSVLKPAADVGIYGAAYKFFEILLNFPAMFAGLILPFLARFAYKEWGRYRLYLQYSFDALLIVAAPMVIVTLFYARQIMDVIAGPGQFQPAERVLKILIFAAAITFLGQLLGYAVVALNVQKKMVLGYLTGAIVGLGLYFVLIPRYTYFGAAYATVAVEAIVLLYSYLLTSRAASFFLSFKILGKIALAAIPMSLFFYFVTIRLPLPVHSVQLQTTINWVIEVFAGLLIYLLLLFLFHGIPKTFVARLMDNEADNEA